MDFCCKVFDALTILALKLIFVNQVNSWLLINLLAYDILFLISVVCSFVFKSALVPRFVMSGILFSISVSFVLRAGLITMLTMSGSLLSIFIA